MMGFKFRHRKHIHAWLYCPDRSDAHAWFALLAVATPGMNTQVIVYILVGPFSTFYARPRMFSRVAFCSRIDGSCACGRLFLISMALLPSPSWLLFPLVTWWRAFPFRSIVIYRVYMTGRSHQRLFISEIAECLRTHEYILHSLLNNIYICLS